MSDLLKITGGAVLGFLLSLLAEPFKVLIYERRKIGRMEKALASEMRYICEVISIPLSLHAMSWRDTTDTRAYDHYFDKEKEIFFRLKYFNQIDSFYTTLAQAKALQDHDAGLLLSGNCVILFKCIISTKPLRPAFKRAVKQMKDLDGIVDMVVARHTLRDPTINSPLN